MIQQIEFYCFYGYLLKISYLLVHSFDDFDFPMLRFCILENGHCDFYFVITNSTINIFVSNIYILSTSPGSVQSTAPLPDPQTSINEGFTYVDSTIFTLI